MKNELGKDIAKVVRGLLAERRMTVQEFAALMGEPNSSVARWINGGGAFKTDKIDEMAAALGMDVGELVMLAVAKRAGGHSGPTQAEREDLRRAVERARPKPKRKGNPDADTGT